MLSSQIKSDSHQKFEACKLTTMGNLKVFKFSYHNFIFLATITCCFIVHGFSAQTDTINSTFSLQDPDTIVSPGNVFKLGFFSPHNTTNRYLAIFYVVSEQTTVWIANRDSPLRDSSGRVSISVEGNLVLTNGQNQTIWSTDLTTNKDRVATNATARLLDSGNLVMYNDSTGNSTWDSFSHPTDTLIPGMKVIDNTITGQKLLVSSWKNASNPEIGSFTLGIRALEIPQIFTWNADGTPHYRSGQFNGQIFIGLRSIYGTSFWIRMAVKQLSPGIFYLQVPTDRFLSKFTLSSSGTVEKQLWNDQKKSWDLLWAFPSMVCDVYNTCGPFASCNDQDSPICSCLKGFKPMNRDEWDRGNWTRGCVRRTQLQCSRNNNTNGDDFLKMPFMKVPDFAEPFPSNQIEECRVRCLSDCSCIAYAHDPNNIGCMFWRERDGLVDIQQFLNVGYDLYVRLSKSELDSNHKDRKVLIILTVVGAVVAISAIFFIAWCCMVKKKDGGVEDRKLYEGNITSSSDLSSVIFLQDKSSKVNIEELPLFSFETLSIASSRFSNENVLGKGGFGTVYKGKLSNGKEIAVKRLSEASKQGKREFTNEVVVISKLQHRNLVRLMGCCAEKEDKMLIYEYMPNKSLDVYLFDPSLRSENPLDWKKRYNIIEGVGRGLLYLHQDSRLRIIHRDLKPSNVLLDQDWEPKISDFGMARIFDCNEDQANTARVVGTYGYMAPEYAVEGRFSEKSDVYSFGVVVLEIISGKKNTRYYNHKWSLSLLGCAWKLWSEGNGMDLVDQNIADPNFKDEIVRCIHIALLCVQESAYDRPTIQTVLSMLSREIVDLPFPQQPVFAEKWDRFDVSSTEPVRYSIHQLSVTELDGR